MNKNTSISLGNYFSSFVENSILVGRFKNAISEGIESGIAYDFDPYEHLESLKLKQHSNG